MSYVNIGATCGFFNESRPFDFNSTVYLLSGVGILNNSTLDTVGYSRVDTSVSSNVVNFTDYSFKLSFNESLVRVPTQEYCRYLYPEGATPPTFGSATSQYNIIKPEAGGIQWRNVDDPNFDSLNVLHTASSGRKFTLVKETNANFQSNIKGILNIPTTTQFFLINSSNRNEYLFNTGKVNVLTTPFNPDNVRKFILFRFYDSENRKVILSIKDSSTVGDTPLSGFNVYMDNTIQITNGLGYDGNYTITTKNPGFNPDPSFPSTITMFKYGSMSDSKYLYWDGGFPGSIFDLSIKNYWTSGLSLNEIKKGMQFYFRDLTFNVSSPAPGSSAIPSYMIDYYRWHVVKDPNVGNGDPGNSSNVYVNAQSRLLIDDSSLTDKEGWVIYGSSAPYHLVYVKENPVGSDNLEPIGYLNVIPNTDRVVFSMLSPPRNYANLDPNAKIWFCIKCSPNKEGRCDISVGSPTVPGTVGGTTGVAFKSLGTVSITSAFSTFLQLSSFTNPVNMSDDDRITFTIFDSNNNQVTGSTIPQTTWSDIKNGGQLPIAGALQISQSHSLVISVSDGSASTENIPFTPAASFSLGTFTITSASRDSINIQQTGSPSSPILGNLISFRIFDATTNNEITSARINSVLLNTITPGGTQLQLIDGSNLPSGSYTLRLSGPVSAATVNVPFTISAPAGPITFGTVNISSATRTGITLSPFTLANGINDNAQITFTVSPQDFTISSLLWNSIKNGITLQVPSNVPIGNPYTLILSTNIGGTTVSASPTFSIATPSLGTFSVTNATSTSIVLGAPTSSSGMLPGDSITVSISGGATISGAPLTQWNQISGGFTLNTSTPLSQGVTYTITISTTVAGVSPTTVSYTPKSLGTFSINSGSSSRTAIVLGTPASPSMSPGDAISVSISGSTTVSSTITTSASTVAGSPTQWNQISGGFTLNTSTPLVPGTPYTVTINGPNGLTTTTATPFTAPPPTIGTFTINTTTATRSSVTLSAPASPSGMFDSDVMTLSIWNQAGTSQIDAQISSVAGTSTGASTSSNRTISWGALKNGATLNIANGQNLLVGTAYNLRINLGNQTVNVPFTPAAPTLPVSAFTINTTTATRSSVTLSAVGTGTNAPTGFVDTDQITLSIWSTAATPAQMDAQISSVAGTSTTGSGTGASTASNRTISWGALKNGGVTLNIANGQNLLVGTAYDLRFTFQVSGMGSPSSPTSFRFTPTVTLPVNAFTVGGLIRTTGFTLTNNGTATGFIDSDTITLGIFLNTSATTTVNAQISTVGGIANTTSGTGTTTSSTRTISWGVLKNGGAVTIINNAAGGSNMVVNTQYQLRITFGAQTINIPFTPTS